MIETARSCVHGATVTPGSARNGTRRSRRSSTAAAPSRSAELGASEATIRRDLDLLDEAGSLRRVRGGATARRGSVRPEADLRSFADVAGSATAAKQAIASRACDQVRDGDVIALD